MVIVPLIKSAIREKRPHCETDDRDMCDIQCYGMPSAHAVSITLPVVYLYLLYQNSLVLKIGIPLIILVCIQRVRSNRHSLKQVIVGVIFGICFAVMGFNMEATTQAMLMMLTFSLIFFYSFMLESGQKIVEFDKIYKRLKPPSYLSDVSRECLQKKINADNTKVHTVLSIAPAMNFQDNFYVWKDVENVIDKSIHKFTNFDKIVGILSGGAFLADYISHKTGIPTGYIKLSFYGDKESSFDLAMTGLINQTTKKVKKPSKVYGLDNVYGKDILLVDDTVETGNTVESAKDYLMKKGARSVKVYALFLDRLDQVDYYSLSLPLRFVPWGLQN